MIKKLRRNAYAAFVALMATASFTACSKDAADTDDVMPSGNARLTVRTKAVSAGESAMTVATPINIYVFDSKEKCVSKSTLDTEKATANLKLEAGNYKVCAIAGASDDDYRLPSKEEATLQSVVSLTTNHQHSDLMAATNSVLLTDGEDSDLTLSMQRKVWLLTTISITDVPDDVTSITATLGALYENITLQGSYSGEHGTQQITLSKQNATTTWQADCNLFLLPSVGNPTVTFTFRYADGSTKTFSYTSQKPLVANYKISINVNYIKIKEPTLKCVITGTDWAGSDVLSFDADEKNFTTTEPGTGGTTGGNPTDNPTTGGTTVDDGTMPTIGTLYKGCYVLKIEKSSNATAVTLVAPEQYNTWTYTKGDQTEMKKEVNGVLSKLTVDGISSWRLPALAEIQYVGDNLTAVNDNLEKLGLQKFIVGSPSANSFLFDDVSGNIYGYILKTGNTMTEPGNGKSIILRPFTTLLFK